MVRNHGDKKIIGIISRTILDATCNIWINEGEVIAWAETLKNSYYTAIEYKGMILIIPTDAVKFIN